MKSLRQQNAVHIGMPFGEIGTPDPWIAWDRFYRLHIICRETVYRERNFFKAFPCSNVFITPCLSLQGREAKEQAQPYKCSFHAMSDLSTVRYTVPELI